MSHLATVKGLIQLFGFKLSYCVHTGLCLYCGNGECHAETTSAVSTSPSKHGPKHCQG